MNNSPKMAEYTKKILIALLVFSASLSLSLSLEPDDGYHVEAPHFPSPPKIDGKLENPIWETGAILDTFTQFEPLEGAQPSEKTVAYIGYDRKNLYIALRCFDSNPKAIRACLTQRDKVRGDDEVTIYLDTFDDKKRAFVFQVNPCGIQTDGIYTEVRRRGRGRGGFFGFDRNWDAYFLSNAHMDDLGYTVELAIPFKSLRFPNKQPQEWGMQIMRTIRRKNEEIYWYPRSRDERSFLVQAGTLEIAGKIDRGKNLEFMPVFTGLKEHRGKVDPDAGLNLKYGITSDMTTDFTYNPDFSQVEADMPQIDVNQRYELYYPEKRPFFLEGKDFYDTPFELVYTRTIVNPVWGTKLTGKTGKTTIGFLSAYDENPTEIDIPCETELPESCFQRALINVFRLKQDLYPESHIGLIITDRETGPSLQSITENYNRVFGLDGHFRFLKDFRFSFQVVGSKSKWGETKTDFVPATNANFSYASRHLNFSADWRSIPEDFEGSVGFFRRKDIQSLETRISYAFLPQNEWIISIRPSFNYRRIYDFGGTLTDEQYRLSAFISGWRQTHVWANYSYSLERYEGIDFYKKNFRVSLSSEPLSWLSGRVEYSFGDSIYYEDDPFLGYKTSAEFDLTLRPLTNLSLFYKYDNDKFYESKGGEKVYTVNIITQRIRLQLSRTLSIRLITDYDSYDKELFNSILLSYELSPGTVFYIGIDDNQQKYESGPWEIQGRFYFVKFSYWWRI